MFHVSFSEGLEVQRVYLILRSKKLSRNLIQWPCFYGRVSETGAEVNRGFAQQWYSFLARISSVNISSEWFLLPVHKRFRWLSLQQFQSTGRTGRLTGSTRSGSTIFPTYHTRKRLLHALVHSQINVRNVLTCSRGEDMLTVRTNERGREGRTHHDTSAFSSDHARDGSDVGT